jgi:SAM-dependent methyltransferase
VVEAARSTARRAGIENATFGVGEAHANDLLPGNVDLVMIRHVLAHNGSQEQAIVDHAATLVRPGGVVYLVDIDMPAVRVRPAEDDLADLDLRYERWHAQQGSDLSVGLRLRELLVAAGLTRLASTWRTRPGSPSTCAGRRWSTSTTKVRPLATASAV